MLPLQNRLDLVWFDVNEKLNVDASLEIEIIKFEPLLFQITVIPYFCKLLNKNKAIYQDTTIDNFRLIM